MNRLCIIGLILWLPPVFTIGWYLADNLSVALLALLMLLVVWSATLRLRLHAVDRQYRRA